MIDFKSWKEYASALSKTEDKIELIQGRFIPNLDSSPDWDEFYVFFVKKQKFFDDDSDDYQVAIKRSYLASFRTEEEASLFKKIVCQEGGQFDGNSFDVIIKEVYDVWDVVDSLKERFGVKA